MKHSVDTKKLPKVVQYCVDKYRKDLNCLSILCAWRDTIKMDGNLAIAADVRKLSNRDRDLFNYDVCLTVDMNIWDKLDKHEREKLIFHELEHIQIEYEEDEDIENEEENKDPSHIDERPTSEIFNMLITPRIYEGTPKRDKQGRTCFYLIDHDIDIRRFKSELLMFGLSNEEKAVRKYLNFIYKKINKA